MGGGPGQGFRSVAYFVNWAIYARKHRPQDLPIENLTHILYAFANVRADSGEVHLTDGWADTDIHWEGDSWNDSGTNLYGCMKQLNLLKRRNRNLKVLLSAVRSAMDQYASTLPEWYHFELTVACPAGAQNYQKLNLPAMDALLDFWNLMAYDYAGSWDSLAGHQANLQPCQRNPNSTPFSTAAALAHYTSHGVAPDKIVLGMPLYGRAFENTDGPGTPFSGVGEGAGRTAYLTTRVAGVPRRGDGRELLVRRWQRKMVTYDTVHMARKKAEYVRGWGLGGAMWWESSADKPGPESLIGNVVHTLGGPHALLRTDNCIHYPETKYDNLRNGFEGQ
ncbi:glycosyl hydrolase family 18 protein [Colletotrichum tofieldiae]|nr:glycosyl hydrolase family 18 protein [Colletotrichum tofieldiae]